MSTLFVIALFVAAAGILISLLARLLSSYPLAFFGIVVVVGASVLAFVDGNLILGIFFLIFCFLAAIFAGLNLYKNSRGAFWWWLGSVAAIITTAAVLPDQYFNPIVDNLGKIETYETAVAEKQMTEAAAKAKIEPLEKANAELLPKLLIALAIVLAVFFVIGLLGSLIIPRLKYKDKNQRKHLTNVDPIIGQKVKLTSVASDGKTLRGYIGDVDWAVAPLYTYESFKVGDVVKVHKIKGVTLLCTRDGKDYRKEVRDRRKEEKAKAKAEAEARRKAKEEAKAKKPEPVKEEPKVEEPKPAPVVEPEPVVEEPTPEPVVEEPAPVVEEPAPVVEEPAPEPVVEEPAPVVEEPAPVKEKAEFVPFSVRLHAGDDFLKEAYNELKSEILSYGIKSRISSTSDRFRLHKKEYVKMVIAGKYLKLYFALDPADYKDSTYPFEDASRMGAHKETPFVFKIKSGLSVRRAKVLIADVAKKGGLVQSEVVKHDHEKDVE